MKNKFLIFTVLIFVTGISCKKQNNNNYITETEAAEALSNKNIDSLINGIGERVYTIVPGTKTVFKYDYTWSDLTPGLMDAYVHRIYAFSIVLTASQTSFSLTDYEIKEASGFYAYFYGEGSSRSALITKGKITGSKTNNTTWHVVMHFELPNSTIDLAKNFTIK